MVQKFSISTQAGLALCTYFFLIIGLGGSRTHDHRFRKPSLYPTELQSLKVINGETCSPRFLEKPAVNRLYNNISLYNSQTLNKIRPTGVKPVTFGFGDRHSIQLSYGRLTFLILTQIRRF